MQTTIITVKQAKDAVDTLVADFGTDVDFNAVDVSTVIKALASEETLHIRDYVLGIPSDFDLDYAIGFAEELRKHIPLDESYPITTILGAFYFEKGQSEKALQYLAVALDIKPKYSLAELLTRVVNAGWPVEAFAKMREELHPKVLGMIEDESEKEM
jgi:tetratricopeptide (TPR) repeat protein